MTVAVVHLIAFLFMWIDMYKSGTSEGALPPAGTAYHFVYQSAFVHHTPGSGNTTGVCRRSTLTGSLTPPTIYRFPLFAWDALNARTETGEAYHYTHPVSSRLARCPSLDPSDVVARLAGHGASPDGALLLQSRIKNVLMLIVLSATVLLCIQFSMIVTPELSLFLLSVLAVFRDLCSPGVIVL